MSEGVQALKTLGTTDLENIKITSVALFEAQMTLLTGQHTVAVNEEAQTPPLFLMQT